MKKLDDEVENSFAYLDDCLYDFVSKLKATPQWKNLLIVVTSDHGIVHGKIDHMPSGTFEIHKQIRLPQILSKGFLLIDLYLHYPMVEVLMKVPNCCLLNCEGYQDGYGRALNQETEGVAGLCDYIHKME